MTASHPRTRLGTKSTWNGNAAGTATFPIETVTKGRAKKLTPAIQSAFCALFGRRYATAAPDVALLDLLVQPQAVVLLGPVDVHLTLAHCLERALHADGADVDVG